jgi:hypothetical protein
MRFIGERWLTNEFDKRLETFKHEQQKEMARVRYRIDSYFDRAVRLHQMEFEVLPELWGRLVTAHDTVEHFTAWLQQSPDVDNMNPEHLEVFLDASPLMEWQKKELRQEKFKGSYYAKSIFWNHLNRTKDAYSEFHSYLIKRGIFLPKELQTKFESLRGMMWKTIIEREIAQDPGAKMVDRPEKKRLVTEGEKLKDEIKEIVETTLRDSKSLFADSPLN